MLGGFSLKKFVNFFITLWIIRSLTEVCLCLIKGLYSRYIRICISIYIANIILK